MKVGQNLLNNKWGAFVNKIDMVTGDRMFGNDSGKSKSKI